MPTEEEQNHLCGLCWDRPWILKRSEFHHVKHYLYAGTWSDFVVGEARMETCHVDADQEEDARKGALIRNGKTMFGVRCDGTDDKGCHFTFYRLDQGRKLRVNSELILSRTDPDLDAWKHPCVIEEKDNDGYLRLVFKNTSILQIYRMVSGDLTSVFLTCSFRINW